MLHTIDIRTSLLSNLLSIKYYISVLSEKKEMFAAKVSSIKYSVQWQSGTSFNCSLYCVLSVPPSVFKTGASH